MGILYVYCIWNGVENKRRVDEIEIAIMIHLFDERKGYHNTFTSQTDLEGYLNKGFLGTKFYCDSPYKW